MLSGRNKVTKIKPYFFNKGLIQVFMIKKSSIIILLPSGTQPAGLHSIFECDKAL